MTLQDTAPFVRGAAGILTPVPGRSLEAELTHHVLGDRVEEVLLVLHVVVQRHRLDAELAPDTSHRHRLEALTVHDGEGGLHDPVPREPLARSGSFCCRHVHLPRVDGLTALRLGVRTS
jgi:hypothetical protein